MLTLRAEKRLENACDGIGFSFQNHMIANMYNALEFATCNENRSSSRKLNLLELVVNSPLIKFYIDIYFLKHSLTKNSVLSSLSSNFVPEMSIAVASIQLLILFVKGSCITCCKKSIFEAFAVLLSFY